MWYLSISDTVDSSSCPTMRPESNFNPIHPQESVFFNKKTGCNRIIAKMKLLVAFLSLLSLATAQFGFFDQMFGGQDGHEQHHHQHQQQNNPSDAGHYRAQYEGCTYFMYPLGVFFASFGTLLTFTAYCDKYLCPDTLACVHFPHHCPCAWDANEEKFELGDGNRLCISRGGFKAGEAARKIELARKGLL